MMQNCLSCGGLLMRVHRTFAEKIVYIAVLECSKCARRQVFWCLFLLGRRTHCPHCWNVNLDKLKSVDFIETMYKNPLSYFQKWLGGNLYHCSFCRLQFYDLRDRFQIRKRVRVALPAQPVSSETELVLLASAIGTATEAPVSDLASAARQR
jgi:hypothetical protein